MKIGWWVGKDVDWAFLHLAWAVQAETPDYEHVINDHGDINLVISAAFLPAMQPDKSHLARLSGHRVFTNNGVTFNFSDPLVIGWWVGPTQWAFRYLAEHIRVATPECEHKENAPGNVNIVLDPVTLLNHGADKSYIMHLDGHRFFEDRGVCFDDENNASDMGERVLVVGSSVPGDTR